jgi:4-amino-4-deoxy-L-arabinose transferase-like glycosyltransferase
LAILLASAFLLRVLRLDFQPLWWDEGYSVWFATNSLGEMLADTARDIHPPLYYALLHGWITLVGARPESLRLFSVMIGTLTVALIYAVARRLGGERAGFIAAFLLVISPFHIYYSQEVRMYGLVTFFGLASIGLAARWIGEPAGEREGEKGATRWLLGAGYVGATAAAMYSQYYAAFLPLAQTTYVLAQGRRARRVLIPWLMAQVVLAILYLPWLLYAGPLLVGYVAQKVVLDADRALAPLDYFGRHLAAFAGGHFEGALASWWAVGILPLVGVGVLWYRFRENERRPLPFLAAQVVIPLLLGFVVSLRYPFVPPRFERLLLLALPPCLLLIAIVLASLHGRALAMGLAPFVMVAALSLAMFYTVPRYADDDYRPLIAQTEGMGGASDVVYCVFPWQVGYFRSYGREQGPRPSPPPPPVGRGGARPPLQSALAQGQRIWFPEHLALGAVLERQAEAYLLENAIPVLNEWHGPHTRLTFWSPLQGLASGSGSARFAGGLALLAARVGDAPVAAGAGPVPLELVWQRESAWPEESYRLGLRLTDARGHTWAQRDSEPVGGTYPFSQWQVGEAVIDRHGLWVPAGTPPGEYQVRLSVYRARDGRALDLLDAKGQPQGVEQVLAAVRVVPPETIPPVSALPIQHRRAWDSGPLRLLGFSLPLSETFRTGGDLPLTLFWQARRAPAEDYLVWLRLTDGTRKEVARRESPMAWPARTWRVGELARDPQPFHLPADLPDGRYHLEMTSVPASRSGTAQVRWQTLAVVAVQGRPHSFIRPQPRYPLDVRFGEGARLIGYDLEAEARPGGQVRLTLHWQATAQMGTSYAVFVHLVAQDGRFGGQHDGIPGDGALPTTGWVIGEFLLDEHIFTIKPEAEPGPYLLEVGLYEAVSGQRLPVRDALGRELGDHLVLDGTPMTVER